MVGKARGNRAPYILGGSSGIGSAAINNGIIGKVAVYGQAGDFIVLGIGEVASLNKVDQGYNFQTVGGAAVVDFTLEDELQAKSNDPNIYGEITWCNPLTLAPGEIKSTTMGFSALRVTFTATTVVYIVTR